MTILSSPEHVALLKSMAVTISSSDISSKNWTRFNENLFGMFLAWEAVPKIFKWFIAYWGQVS